MFNPVSESWVSVKGHGSCSSTMTPNTLQKAPRNGSTQNARLLKWPAMSPDLNPIEHLGGDLKTAVGRRHPSNVGELEQFAQEEWSKLPVVRCGKLIHGWRKRLTAVISSPVQRTESYSDSPGVSVSVNVSVKMLNFLVQVI